MAGQGKGNGGKGRPFRSGGIYEVEVDGAVHILSEDYFYKTEAYYTIVRNEVRGVRTVPSSMSVIEAYVVPICLSRAKAAGVPVPEWGLTYSYAPTPCLIYGVNYYSTPSQFYRVDDLAASAEQRSTLCHGDKYAFMFQKLEPASTVSTHLSVYGELAGIDGSVAAIAGKVFEIFQIPIVNITIITTGEDVALSSLAPVRYSKLTAKERGMLESHLLPKGGGDGG